MCNFIVDKAWACQCTHDHCQARCSMSKQRSIRKKPLSLDDEEDEGSGALPAASVKAAQARRDKDRKGAEAKKPILSFDEDLGASGGASKDATKKSTSKPRPSLRAPLPPKAEPAGTAAYTQVSAAGARWCTKMLPCLRVCQVCCRPHSVWLQAIGPVGRRSGGWWVGGCQVVASLLQVSRSSFQSASFHWAG